jgi:hypothetical protein
MSQTYKQGSEGSEAQNRTVEGHDVRNGGLEAQNGFMKDQQTSSSRGYHQYDEEQDPDPDLDPQKSKTLDPDTQERDADPQPCLYIEVGRCVA